MGWVYRHLIRPSLFTQNPEDIHERTLRALRWISRHELFAGAMASFLGAPDLPSELFGLRFPNPVGLAAGMDKNADALPAWQCMGFGFTELGAVTWLAQPGNPLPRLFRVVPEQAIVNRMGFNNRGAEAVAQVLAEWRRPGLWPKHPVGMNLGKSKVTPLDKAADDYAQSFRVLQPYLDFFVVNVSSPNTPNLRQLQDKSALDEILAAIQETQRESAKPEVRRTNVDVAEIPNADAERRQPTRKPILVKVAPDLSFPALDEILELVGPREIAGIVATNTTLARPQSNDAAIAKIYAENGGLSGRPLSARSTEVIRHLYRQTRGALPVIGVGGIFNADDAWEKITAGASLLQIYTSLVYEGPGTPRAIVQGLQKRLEASGLRDLRQAIGIATL